MVTIRGLINCHTMYHTLIFRTSHWQLLSQKVIVSWQIVVTVGIFPLFFFALLFLDFAVVFGAPNVCFHKATRG